MKQPNNADAELQDKELVITRTFNAPRELVFKMWAQAEHMAHWWGPKGFELIIAELDLRPGGTFHYQMRSPDGFEMWGKFAYHEIDPPQRIVFVTSFSDRDGSITRAPFNPSWPLEVMNVLTLEEVNGKTKLTLAGGPINASEDELKVFREGVSSMQQGFGGTFDQLDEYLATI